MSKFIIESNGRKSKAINLKCFQCGETFLKKESLHIAALNKNQKRFYCSPRCASDAQKIRIDVNCEWCGEKLEIIPKRFKASKSGIFFCDSKCQGKFYRIENCPAEAYPSHYKVGKWSYRELAFRFYEHRCEVCGYDEFHEVLDVHHIDSDRTNNSIENLIILCPIHHAMLTRNIAYLQNRKLMLAVA